MWEPPDLHTFYRGDPLARHSLDLGCFRPHCSMLASLQPLLLARGPEQYQSTMLIKLEGGLPVLFSAQQGFLPLTTP